MSDVNDERRALLLKRAAEDDAAVARLGDILAEIHRRREAARAEGQTDLSRFDAAERDAIENRAHCRRSAEAMRRAARGEPCPTTRLCDAATYPAAPVTAVG